MIKKLNVDKSVVLQHSQEFIKLCELAENEVVEISSEAVQQKIDSRKSFYLIDVRDKEEIDAQGYISEAFHVSKGWIEADIHHLVSDQDADIVLYCGSGKRSLLAAYSLSQMGYSNVKSLAGGYKEYKFFLA